MTASPIDLNLRDELDTPTRVGVSLSGQTTYAQVEFDPTARALVTGLTFDFTVKIEHIIKHREFFSELDDNVFEAASA